MATNYETPLSLYRKGQQVPCDDWSTATSMRIGGDNLVESESA